MKENEIKREVQLRANSKKEMEKNQQQLFELRSQVESMKSTISSLQRDIKHLHDVNSEHKVSLSDLLIVQILQGVSIRALLCKPCISYDRDVRHSVCLSVYLSVIRWH